NRRVAARHPARPRACTVVGSARRPVAAAIGGTAMNRWWPLLPMGVMAAAPIWTAPSALAVALEAVACLFCVLGVFRRRAGPVTAGGCIAMIGYTFALWSG